MLSNVFTVKRGRHSKKWDVTVKSGTSYFSKVLLVVIIPFSPSFVMLHRKVVTLITELNTPSVVAYSLVVSQSAVVGFFHGKGDPLHCRIIIIDSERKKC